MDIDDRVKAIIDASELDRIRLFNEGLADMSPEDLEDLSDNLIKNIEQTIEDVGSKTPKSLIEDFGQAMPKSKAKRKATAKPKPTNSGSTSFFDLATSRFEEMAEQEEQEEAPGSNWGGFRDWERNLSANDFAPTGILSKADALRAATEKLSNGTAALNPPEGFTSGTSEISGLKANETPPKSKDGEIADLETEVQELIAQASADIKSLSSDPDVAKVTAPIVPKKQEVPSEGFINSTMKSMQQIASDSLKEGKAPDLVATKPKVTETKKVPQEAPKAATKDGIFKRSLKAVAWASPIPVGVFAGWYGLETMLQPGREGLVVGAGVLVAINFAILLSVFKVNIWRQTQIAIAAYLYVASTYVEPLSVGSAFGTETLISDVTFVTIMAVAGLALVLGLRKRRQAPVKSEV